jgi:hypothetical protein
MAVALAALAMAAALGSASPALAGLQHEFAVFSDCPVANPAVGVCIYSTTTSGEFKIGNKTVPIDKTVVLQGGIKEGSTELIPAADGNTLSKTPLLVPGGIIGIELLGPLTEVTATAELAGTVQVSTLATLSRTGTAVQLPLKVKLDNALLGTDCRIGQFEPQLTTGETNPPPPASPISGGHGMLTQAGNGKIQVLTGASLVDNAFAVPGVEGFCGGLLFLAVNPATDLIVGIPAGPGHNAAILNGSLEAAPANLVRIEATLPELGRCVKATSTKEGKTTLYHGLYLDSGCTTETTNRNGKFEWEAGPGSMKQFTAGGLTATLETVGKAKVKCMGSAGSGEYTGTKTANVSVTFTGCVRSSSLETCQSSGAGAGEVQATGLQAKLGFIKDAVGSEGLVASVGWDLAKDGTIVSATCGASKEALLVTGSVIAPVPGVDKMVSAFSVKPKALTGIQAPESFEEGAKDVLSATLGAGSPEQAGLTTSEKWTGGERLEIRAFTN